MILPKTKTTQDNGHDTHIIIFSSLPPPAHRLPLAYHGPLLRLRHSPVRLRRARRTAEDGGGGALALRSRGGEPTEARGRATTSWTLRRTGGVVDEAGDKGECGNILFVFIHLKKHSPAMICCAVAGACRQRRMDEAARTRMRTGAAARTKAVGKDGGRGQRGRNVARSSSLREVHRRHDGAPSSSGEGR